MAVPPASANLSSNSPQLSSQQFLNWSQNQADTTSAYADPNLSSLPGLYGVTANAPMQVARRSNDHQLVHQGDAQNADGHDGDWADLADGLQLDPHRDSTYEDIDELERRAQVAKRDAVAKRKQIPPFVQKLSSFLDESRNTDLIRWSDDGDSFVVLDEDEFAKKLIPELFKHNNYASFVRQLNMYGFHKKVGLSDNSMRASERKNKSPSEYHNPYFRRGHPDLLWLINKPKNPGGVTHARGKQADSAPDESPHVVPNAGSKERTVATSRGQSGPATGRTPATESPLPEQDMTDVQRQLLTIQQQQKAISNAINRLRRDHNQIYEQAAAFQSMHDRHESSINAILTFLATVYNRSLEGHQGGNFSNMLSNAIPQDAQGQRNMVGVMDYPGQGSPSMPRFKKQSLLLGPPPTGQDHNTSRASTLSPGSVTGSGPPQSGRPSVSHVSTRSRARSPGAAQPVEELFDAQTPAAASGSPSMAAQGTDQSSSSTGQMPQRDILSMINSTNAVSGNGSAGPFDFPGALTHAQSANGNSPLTPQQRDDMLQMIVQDSNGGNGGNNALMTSSAPPVPDLTRLDQNRAELDRLFKMQNEQAANMASLKSLIEPLSPSGSIPGLEGGQYYANVGSEAPGPLELDQFLDSGDYFTNPDQGDLTWSGDGAFNEDINFNLDGSNDVAGAGDPEGSGGRVIETVNSSEAASPVQATEADGGSPSRKRRRNG
ncbi:MAG: stress-responsive transcription factor hsf1 [Caeruleum heppii]|nr:MAG: stress-responsive transcription factor hsf1 [Caeruleum heppii]